MPLVCNQVTESTDSGTEVESQDQPAEATEQDVQSKVTKSTEQLKPPETTEPTNEPEEDLEQSTGKSNPKFIHLCCQKFKDMTT